MVKLYLAIRHKKKHKKHNGSVSTKTVAKTNIKRQMSTIKKQRNGTKRKKTN